MSVWMNDQLLHCVSQWTDGSHWDAVSFSTVTALGSHLQVKNNYLERSEAVVVSATGSVMPSMGVVSGSARHWRFEC